jgi:thioesterase domain-containing protein/acyl carrier protein
MRREPGLTRHDRLLAVTTLSFDIAALELLLPLIVGARIVLVDRETTVNGEALQRTLDDCGVTAMQATPATWRLLLDTKWAEKKDLKILCGGESLSREMARELLSRGAELWNMYGPTETTIWSSVSKVSHGDSSITIGRPIENTDIYVLDQNLDLVPPGVAGELYIGGDGVARGYLNQPGLTSEKFVPHPFNSRKGSRLYKTGDLARYLEDGRLEVLGRMDQQVKIRGHRIESGEIENQLMRHPDVAAAVVVAQVEASEEKRLIAYVVLTENRVLNNNELGQFLRKCLPEYMVPSAFVVLTHIPLTPNGKVDRRALPPPPRFRPELDEALVRPRNGVELQLQAIWESLLNIQPIGMSDDFFDVGGHSLLGVRLLQRVEKRFGQKIPLSVFFQNPTIRSLARVLSQEKKGKTFTTLVPIREKGTRKPFFCVHSIGGDVVRFYYLARYLDNNHPVYGFQAPHPSELDQEVASVEDTAARYISAMKEVQSVGPYLIGGYSFGSVIAFEMAQQLLRGGERVGVLALLDGVSPLEQQAVNERSDAVVLAGFARDLARTSGVELDLFHEEIKRLSESEGMRFVIDKLKDHKLIESDADPTYFSRFVRGIRLRSQSVRRYRPSIYPGVITLFRASQLERESAAAWREAGADVNDLTRGWDKLSTHKVDVRLVTGYHSTMVNEPHVKHLAKELSDCINQID